LAQIDEKQSSALSKLLFYSTYTTGVVLRSYDYSFLKAGQDPEKKAKISIVRNNAGYAVVNTNNEEISVISVNQHNNAKMNATEGLAIIEASYTPPHVISQKMAEHKMESDHHYYRTSRGSEPKLNIGLNYALGLCGKNSASEIYGGTIELCDEHENIVISITLDEINNIVGNVLDKTTITKIFQNLGFDISKSQGTSFVIAIPRYRHDILNKQDIVEEIVRLVGIDNIKSKPFTLQEKNPLSTGYFQFKKLRKYRHSAANQGFFESVHFVFDEKAKLLEYGFKCVDEDLELLNPIVNTLDTMRPTLLHGLLNAASRNMKSGYKDVRLFEIGSVFSTKREESTRMAFIYSGDAYKDGILNSGKSSKIDFGSFVQLISNVVGDIDLVSFTPEHTLANPYQCAKIIFKGEEIGEVFKLHPMVQEAMDLDQTFMCELDFSKLTFDLVEVKPYSKYQASYRDISVVAPQSLDYSEIQKVIEECKTQQIVRYYPIDKYIDYRLGDNASITIRFVLQSLEKTLDEEDINSNMNTILNALNEKLGLILR
jgi:phenylalanyl-tRNA synthetase beta chain